MFFRQQTSQFSASGNTNLSTQDLNTRDNFTTTLGYNAGKEIADNFNIIIGYNATTFTKKIRHTQAIGYQAGYHTSNNYYNLLMGSYAGKNINGNNNILLGYRSGVTLYNAKHNIILTGDGDTVLAGISKITNSIVIGRDIQGVENITNGLFIGSNIIYAGSDSTLSFCDINIANTFYACTTKTKKQIYLGLNNEQILIGKTSNVDDANSSILVIGGTLTTDTIATTNLGVSGAFNVTGSFNISGTLNTSNLNVPGNSFIYSDTIAKGPFLTPSLSTASIISAWLSRVTSNIYTTTPSFWSSSSTINSLQYTSISVLPQVDSYKPFNGSSPSYSSGINLPDGRVVCIPSSVKNIGIFNPYTNIFSTFNNNTIGSVNSINNEYSSGTLISNGSVVFTPYNATNVGIFIASSNYFIKNTSVLNNASFTANSAAYKGSVLLPDRNVLFVPYSNSAIAIYNTSLNGMSNIGVSVSGRSPPYYSGAVLIPDGRVILVPFSSGNIGIFNSSYTYATSKISISGTNQFSGGVLLGDGRILFVPYDSKTIGIYTPSIDTYTTLSITSVIGSATTGGYFSGGVLLPDGRVILVPYNSQYAALVDVKNNTIVVAISGQISSLTNARSYVGGTLLPDGRVVFIPYNSITFGIILGNNIPPPQKELCLHPFFNKF